MKRDCFLSFAILLVALISIQACSDRSTETATLSPSPRDPPPTAYYSPIPPTPKPTKTITPTPYHVPKWQIDPERENFALIVLDYETLDFKAAYFEVFDPCSVIKPGKTDQELISQASNILKMTDERPQLQRVGDFSVFEIDPADFGGVVVLDPCSGQALFAGEIIGLGKGRQIYPINSIDPTALKYESTLTKTPQRINVMTSPSSTDEEGFEAAWNSVQSLNLVHDFATQPYSVLIYLYTPSVLAFDASVAEWLIFLHRGPSQ